MPTDRYSNVAIVLHWLTALSVLLMLGSGLVMTRVDEGGQLAFALYQFHKSLGFMVLALTAVRLWWRLRNPPPPLPPDVRDGMTAWERRAAAVTHLVFYALLVGLPLGGWLLVSLSPLPVPTVWFGLFEIPHLPVPPNEPAYGLVEQAHAVGGWFMGALVALHVGAALRHHLVLKDGVLRRMLPGGRLAVRTAAATLAAVVVVVIWPRGGEAPTATGVTAGAPVAELATAAEVQRWQVDPARSRLGFEGRQSGVAFQGAFRSFDADIRFDPDTPETGAALVVIDTGSAFTGDTQKDSALPGADWFDVAGFPAARFETRGFRRTGEGSYAADATLTIRGIARDVVLPFTLSIDGDEARAQGRLQLVRTDFGIGQGQWSSGSLVALEVDVVVDLVATRQP